ncbi:bifunctional glycosyltransferase family 2 protein/CDP-glycerol:glycerophosphate glycerophosphotransferase [Actinoplanes sp. NEAU-A12]|uniref:Bifunctional glycosyltransferase family 2 protein/CDP-glycerol:glycerophosphate glycerophosphotransferase n=1 Tax=Actinoplanes sandaracinus TaxID=3045177 RepID=A0ABT6WJ57_9ACTN|nr:bifunctional glycosyltransferase family 2 protein/CDP-glycerol:glycerophosphate glycerophosphotransferase [Actinoplanes sandaracinus]MDI6099762.1 bifunctional glycosyltransferase family 2 protein/CDP-glycerol:glycerophosphate glycerophosphotransferase [Actinoplanes sandaracinus]
MTSSPPRPPDVTVVVIVYNDAARIETAVRSVLQQSLRSHEVIVVDDHSTDGTPAVVERLVEQHPDVIRSIRLPANSGHCGAPRNAGVAAARGRFIMFLDSDDTLDQHACRNMVSMAEQSEADMVIGRCVRHDVATGRESSWMPQLVEQKVVYESLHDRPELLYDVLSTNKLYRHDFLTRENLVFLEDRLYEDNLFSAHAYLAAKKIAVIPQRIYTWNVERQAANQSITRRAADIRNITDRIVVTRRIDDLLALHDAGDLRLRKDVRFLENDLRVHLAGLSNLPEENQRALVDAARPYLETLQEEAFRLAKPLPAMAAYLARQGDHHGVATVHDFMTPRPLQPHLTTDLVIRDGRVFWLDRHLDDPLGRDVLDVTDMGFQDSPLSKMRIGGRIDTAQIDGDRATLTGSFTNPIGRISAEAAPKAQLVFEERRGKRRVFKAKAELTVDARRVGWSATFEPAKLLRPIGLIDPNYSLRLHVTVGSDIAELALFAEDDVIDAMRLPVRPKLSRLTADLFQGYLTDSGNVAVRLDAAGSAAKLGTAAISGVRNTHLGSRAWRRATKLQTSLSLRRDDRSTQLSWYENVFLKLPVRKGTVVFESHMGKQFSDSPRAIYEEMRRRGIKFTPIWSYETHPAGFPSGAKLVKRNSWSYLQALAQAEYWIDNQGFPHDLRKRPETTYIQTWHGSAFKRMGFDEAAIKARTESQQKRWQRAVNRFDYFLVRSEHDVRTLTKGMRVGAELLRFGYPRNDALLNGGNEDQLRKLRKRLGIAEGRRVVLYAPTFRPEEVDRPSGLELPFDLEEFVHRFGEDTMLLVRPHYLVSFALPPAYAHAVRNVANVHDVTPLMQIADALITDYSSLMFDYSLLNRPMIFHVPDYDDYVGSSRGSYFDLGSTAPGPLTRTSEELIAAIADLDGNATSYADKRREFVGRFGEYDTGQAAKSVVDHFFGDR